MAIKDNLVYTSFGINRVVEFSTIFPRCAMPKISKCIVGFDRSQLLGGLLANLVNKVVNKPFFNPDYQGEEKDIDALRFFLSGKNKALILKSIALLKQSAKKENIAIEYYLGATEESALYLLREIMALTETEGNATIEKTEKNFLKALLAANTLTIGKGKGQNPFPKNNVELYLAAAFASQLGSSDFIYSDRRLLLLTQTVKCIRFFEYAAKDEVMGPIVNDFCEKYGIKAWWIYPKAIWSVYGLTDGKAGIIDVGRIVMKEAEQYVSVIDKSSVPCDMVIPKQENSDYAVFRARPLIKISANEYVVLNYQLLVERIFNGLYFDFRDLAEQRGTTQSDFKRVYSTDFSEHNLFCGILKEGFRNHCEVMMTEDDCLAADGSKDAKSASPPDFYARCGKVVYLFENKDILMSKELKEKGTIQDYVDFLRTRLFQNEKGSPKGVMQLMNHVRKIRSGEFQKRWDANCPTDAIVYPVLVVPDAKFTLQGVKNLLQHWQKGVGVSMDNVKPIAYTDVGTLCLYQHEFANKGMQTYLDEYYAQSDFSIFEKSGDFNDLPNVMMSFTDYLVHTHNETLATFGNEWAEYIVKPA